MSADRKLLEQAYAAFNARDIDAALATMHPDVIWPNGMEGGFVYGHDAVREYWVKQWAMFDPHVDPLAFKTAADGRVVVDAHQIVRDLTGKVIGDYMVQHVYTLEDGLVTRMEIRKA